MQKSQSEICHFQIRQWSTNFSFAARSISSHFYQIRPNQKFAAYCKDRFRLCATRNFNVHSKSSAGMDKDLWCSTNLNEHPHPHSHIIRGYPCLFPHHLNPLSRESGKRYTPYIWYWLPLALKKHPLSRAFSGNPPKTTPQNTLLSRDKRNTHAAPYAFKWGRGGGGVNIVAQSQRQNQFDLYTYFAICIVIPVPYNTISSWNLYTTWLIYTTQG